MFFFFALLYFFSYHYNISEHVNEPRHDKTNKVSVRPAKTQISLGIRPVWSESSLSAWRRIRSLATHWKHNEDSDQTWRMPRLIWVFARRTLVVLVLSCRGYTEMWVCPNIDKSTNEPRHDKTNKVTLRPAKTQISLGIRPVWSESSLCAQWVDEDPHVLHADSEDSDQPGHPSLRWAHMPFVGFVMRRLKLLHLKFRIGHPVCPGVALSPHFICIVHVLSNRFG